MRQITMNLQPFRCVAVKLKPLAYQRGMDLREGRSASLHATPLPARRREYAQRQHPYATAIQAERNVDMRSIDVVSIASENIGQLVVSSGIEHAEQADSQRAKPATGKAKTGRSRLVASRQDQADLRGQLGLDRLQLIEDSRIHADVSRGPARPDLHTGLNAASQRKQIHMHRQDIRECDG
ncbi:hypothetical protein G3N57_27445 [Paraburkholderia sp. Se-20369]|nr:hypothetical protein [Paraburkholderia sp. Se-20369]